MGRLFGLFHVRYIALEARDFAEMRGNPEVVVAEDRRIQSVLIGNPRVLPRAIPLPPEIAGCPHGFVFLSSILHAHVGELFARLLLEHITGSTLTQGLEQMFVIVIDRRHDTQHGRLPHAQRRHQLQTAAIGQVQVEQRQVERLALRSEAAFGQRRGDAAMRRRKRTRNRLRQPAPRTRVVM